MRKIISILLISIGVFFMIFSFFANDSSIVWFDMILGIIMFGGGAYLSLFGGD